MNLGIAHNGFIRAIPPIVLFLVTAATATFAAGDCLDKVALKVGDAEIRRMADHPALFFESGLAIDADGAPDAYHPRDLGTDCLRNAGSPGNWRGIVTDTGRPDGNPVVQGPDDPNPGYYVSQTSLFDPRRKRNDPRRYVDSNRIPYIALPKAMLDLVHPGDLAMAIRLVDGRRSGAVFADVGPDRRAGEGSIALADALGVPSDPRTGGTHGPYGVFYVLFPGSGDGLPPPAEEIRLRAEALFRAWGGMERVNACRASTTE
jgi:hypothetical protein